MQDIEKIVDELLKEKIQMVFGDSGGAYGYLYERNREQGYLKGLNQVEEYTNGDERSLEVTIPVYDLLTYNLVKDDTTTCIEKQLFTELEKHDIDPMSIFEVADFLNSGLFTGMHIDNNVEYVNTYNYEEYISQTLLYALISNGFDWFVLLEVHNGCDVRSGYTKPQLFKVKDIDYFLAGMYDRRTECECGLNDYTIYGTDDPTDSTGNYISEEEIFKRTYVDNDGNVRCKDCDSIIKGGFMKW